MRVAQISSAHVVGVTDLSLHAARVQGHLNVTTGTYNFRAHLRKHFHQNVSRAACVLEPEGVYAMARGACCVSLSSGSSV